LDGSEARSGYFCRSSGLEIKHLREERIQAVMTRFTRGRGNLDDGFMTALKADYQPALSVLLTSAMQVKQAL
jgi:hypothetical protein